MPDKGDFLDETDGLYARSANSIEKERSVHKGLGRRLAFPLQS
jgi:hypothetical protein